MELVLRAQKLLHTVVHAHGEILFGGGDKTLHKQGASQAQVVNGLIKTHEDDIKPINNVLLREAIRGLSYLNKLPAFLVGLRSTFV